MTTVPVLVCAFGEPWNGPHPLCEAHADLLSSQFEDAVARGEYDRWGYTPAEAKRRKAKQLDLPDVEKKIRAGK